MSAEKVLDRTFKVVFVPASRTKDVEEWELPIPPGQEVECLVNRLRQHFRGAVTLDSSGDVYKEQLKRQMAESKGGDAVTPEMMEMAAGLQLVESVALSTGCKENDFVHVNMYCDDKAVSKGSPVNERACSIATACGLTTHVRGDVFIGRVLDDDDRFERQDFSIPELDSSNTWIQKAREKNMKKAGDPGLARLQAMANQPEVQAAAVGHDPRVDEKGETPEGSQYTWTQNESEVVIEVKCPIETKAKEIDCTFGPQSIKLSCKSFEEPLVLQGKLFQRIDIDGCTWTIETSGGERVLQVTLSKEKNMRWLVLTRND